MQYLRILFSSLEKKIFKGFINRNHIHIHIQTSAKLSVGGVNFLYNFKNYDGLGLGNLLA